MCQLLRNFNIIQISYPIISGTVRPQSVVRQFSKLSPGYNVSCTSVGTYLVWPQEQCFTNCLDLYSCLMQLTVYEPSHLLSLTSLV
jgi:hypothetical protein